MLRYMILSLTSLLYLTSCLPTSNCPQCSKTSSPPPAPVSQNQKNFLRIGAPEINLPPYFITTEKTGLERDIIEKAFASKGYNVIFEYINNRRQKYQEQKLDCITTVKQSIEDQKKNESLSPTNYSNPVVPYHDMAIYLSSKNLKIKTLDDLRITGRKIEAFKGAEENLNLSSFKQDRYYREHKSKASQILMLHRGTIDVLLMDVRMFGFYQNKMYNKVKMLDREREEREKQEARRKNENYEPRHLEISLIFPEHAYQIACQTEQLISDFNVGLNAIKQPNSANKDSLSDYDMILNKPEYQSAAFPELASSEEDAS